MANRALAEATAAAAAEAQNAGDPAEGTAPAETPVTDPPAEPSSEGTPAPGSAGTEGTSTEAQPAAAAKGTEPEAPTEYFGVDLSELPAESRAEIIRTYEEQNKQISKLQRGKEEPAAPAATASEPEPQEPAELSDADIVELLKLDLEDPYQAEAAKTTVPLTRKLIELQGQVEQLSSTTSASETQRHWETTLDSLETQYGKLPVERVELYERAVQENIGDPQDAYWRVVGPARSTILSEVQRRRAEAVVEAKKTASGTRPKSSADTQPAALKSTETKDAVKEAAAQVIKDMGIELSA